MFSRNIRIIIKKKISCELLEAQLEVLYTGCLKKTVRKILQT
jgi:hypothetical protein